MNFDFFKVLKDKDEKDLYYYARFAEKMYSYGLFISVPNIVRYWFEYILKQVCEKNGFKYVRTDDDYQNFDMKSTINRIVEYYNDDVKIKKYFKNCQKSTNDGSHNNIEVKLEDKNFKEDAKTCLSNMYTLYKWYCDEFYKINNLYEYYEYPKIHELEDIIKNYEDLRKQYDDLENENRELKNKKQLSKDIQSDSNQISAKSQNNFYTDLDMWEIKHENERLKAYKREIEQKINKMESKVELNENLVQENIDLSNKLAAYKEYLEQEKTKFKRLKDEFLKFEDDNSIIIKLQKENENLNKELIKIKNIYSQTISKLKDTNVETTKQISLPKNQQTKVQNSENVLKQAYNTARMDPDVDMQLYTDVLDTIHEMVKRYENIYITRNTIKTFLMGDKNANNVKTFELFKLKGFGKYQENEIEPSKIEDILYYLEEGNIITNKNGFYKLLV